MKLESNRKAGSMILSLVASQLLIAGCSPEESAPTSAPPSPLPNAGPSRPAPPPPQANKEGIGTASQVEKDLRKDLASPVIKPDAAIPPPSGTEKKP